MNRIFPDRILDNVYSITLPSAKVQTFSNITNTYNAVQNGSPPSYLYGFVARSQVCTHGDTTPVYTGVSHQVIASGPSTYDEIRQGGVQIARSRTGAEQTELDAFVQFLTGKDYAGSAVSPNASQKFQYYCYDLVSNPYP